MENSKRNDTARKQMAFIFEAVMVSETMQDLRYDQLAASEQQQVEIGLAIMKAEEERVATGTPVRVVIDEFTSVLDR